MALSPSMACKSRPYLYLFYGLAFAAGLLMLHYGQLICDNEPNPSPLLFGVHILSSLGVIAMASAAIGLALHGLNKTGVETTSLALFTFGAIVSLHYIHISDNHTHTSDLGSHVRYASYISQNWGQPFGYAGRESWHSPFYYYVAGITIRIAQWLGTIPVLTALRFLSWLSYLAFSAFSLLTLRRTALSGAGYYASATLLLLWPGSMHLASKINSEMFYYAWYTAAFYYAVLWYQDGHQKYLCRAWVLAAVALAVRNNALILFAVIGWFMMIKLKRGRLSFLSFTLQQYFVVISAILASTIITFGRFFDASRPLATMIPDGGKTPVTAFPFSHFLYSDYLLSPGNPFAVANGQKSFWDFFLTSSVFGAYAWPQPGLAGVMMILLYSIVAYSILPWAVIRRKDIKGVMPFLGGLFIPVMLLILYAMNRSHWASQDARYIYPALVCFVACFGHSQTVLTEQGYIKLYTIGTFLAWSFSGLSIWYFWMQSR